MKIKKTPKQPSPSDKSDKWQELANLVSSTYRRKFSLIEEVKDPALKKIHEQREKIFSKIPKTKK